MCNASLKEIINQDAKFFKSFPKHEQVKMFLTNDHFYLIHVFMKYLRKEEYYARKSGIFNKILEVVYARKKNNLGNKLGFYIKPNSLGAGTVLYHHGNIIINGSARLGLNCKLHGDNCIGNDGKSLAAPILGNNVDVGVGAKIIGGIVIADNVKIGAGAVVTRSCYKEGATLVGVPAKEI